jgi:hypothetical protein
MKDLRGTHVAAVQSAIFRTFGLQTTLSNCRKNSRDILRWKGLKEVEESYKRIFTEELTLENIATSAFHSLDTATDQEFSDMYVYTAAICDIILNPNNPMLEITKKSLELRMRKFKVFDEFTFLFFLELIEN